MIFTLILELNTIHFKHHRVIHSFKYYTYLKIKTWYIITFL
ncbi:unnamed protein product [Schistosoma margrebowiei]|uniref:Uncharacterized protein n=1 Tax=Schistosoma margrebowiei TaxID=48269 RepID=A0A3P8APV4_9TREM|nr:unnamed protein product [Schistosoma margrebowiei]